MGFHLTCSLISLGENDLSDKMQLLKLPPKLDDIALLRLKSVRISYRNNQVTLGDRIKERNFDI